MSALNRIGIALSGFLMGLTTMSIARADRFVNASVSSSGTGGTWGTAYKTLQEALGAMDLMAGETIWVAKGTYYPTALYWNTGDDNISDPRRATFHIPKGVTVLGGFVSGAMDKRDRDPVANETILDGDLASRDLNNDGMPDGPANQIDHDELDPSTYPSGTWYSDNAYHVVTFQNTDAGAVTKLTGFIIQHGCANKPFIYDNDHFFESDGGGVLVRFVIDGPPTAPLIDRCFFRFNQATRWGGALVATGKEPMHVANCRFEHNFVSGHATEAYFFEGYGGAVCSPVRLFTGIPPAPFNWHGSPLTLQNCIFARNKVAYGNGGAIAGSRTANIAEQNGLNIVNCTFYANAVSDGIGTDELVRGHTSFGGHLSNCIVWGDDPSNMPIPNASWPLFKSTALHCDVQGDPPVSWATATVGLPSAAISQSIPSIVIRLPRISPSNAIRP